MAPLPDDVRRLLEGANFAHLATALPDGWPHSVLVWDRLAVKYTGEPFPMRSGVVYLVEPERERSTVLPFRHTPA